MLPTMAPPLPQMPFVPMPLPGGPPPLSREEFIRMQVQLRSERHRSRSRSTSPRRRTRRYAASDRVRGYPSQVGPSEGEGIEVAVC